MMATANASVLREESELESWLHSLSQPLTSISLAIGIAASPITEEERERVLKTAQEECLRAMEQVGALRAVARSAELDALGLKTGVQA